MEFVEAFRNVQDINAIKGYLKKHSVRDYLLFISGINTGLKINELLEIKVGDIMNEDGTAKMYYEQLDEGKTVCTYINANVQAALTEYLTQLPFDPGQYLFLSAKTKKPLTRQHVHRMIHQAVEALGIEGKYGAISMRKTFGYHAFKQGVSISLIQKHFRHATLAETVKYLGISKEENIKTIIDVNL
jgi:site-specific recombinase XerD